MTGYGSAEKTATPMPTTTTWKAEAASACVASLVASQKTANVSGVPIAAKPRPNLMRLIIARGEGLGDDPRGVRCAEYGLRDFVQRDTERHGEVHRFRERRLAFPGFPPADESNVAHDPLRQLHLREASSSSEIRKGAACHVCLLMIGCADPSTLSLAGQECLPTCHRKGDAGGS